jgi:hypothetical protein
MDPLYRSQMPVSRHEVSVLACLVDGDASLGCAES